MTEPETTEPEMNQPETTEPEMTEPEMTEPETATTLDRLLRRFLALPAAQQRQAVASIAVISTLTITMSLAVVQSSVTPSPNLMAVSAPAPQAFVLDDTLSGEMPPSVQLDYVPVAAGSSPPPAQGAPTPYGLTSASTLTASGIPMPAYTAYTRAAATLAIEDPTCAIPWSLIAGIGRVESNHGRFGGATIGDDGVVRPAIIGIRLDGTRAGTARISDSDDGRFDRDTAFDRAVGPMQFLPGTWRIYGRDADPQNMNAAALATARYLCAGSGSVTTEQGRWTAVYRYNHSDSYVSLVLSLADSYASGTVATFPSRPASTPVVADDTPQASAGGTPLSVPVVTPKPTPKPAATTPRPPTATTSTPPPSSEPPSTPRVPRITRAPRPAPITPKPTPSPPVETTTPPPSDPPASTTPPEPPPDPAPSTQSVTETTDVTVP